MITLHVPAFQPTNSMYLLKICAVDLSPCTVLLNLFLPFPVLPVYLEQDLGSWPGFWADWLLTGAAVYLLVITSRGTGVWWSHLSDMMIKGWVWGCLAYPCTMKFPNNSSVRVGHPLAVIVFTHYLMRAAQWRPHRFYHSFRVGFSWDSLGVYLVHLKDSSYREGGTNRWFFSFTKFRIISWCPSHLQR